MGVNNRDVLDAVRRKCLNCSHQNAYEVEHCNIKKCPLHPFRKGINPYYQRADLTESEILKIIQFQNEKTMVVGIKRKSN